ncbi:MAG: TIGR03118 family protein [Bryobacteraceae bacterium]
MMKRQTKLAAAAAMIFAVSAWARSGGPAPRLTGAPGDAAQACTLCHSGTLNSGSGSVKIIYPANVYTPGQTQRMSVQVSDPGQRRWGFQLTARLASNLQRAQAGDFAPADTFTQVICESGGQKPCAADGPVQFIEHTRDGTRNGATGGVTFDFDWTAPAAGSGKVIFYAAGNAANGDGANTGDHIYTTTLELDEGAAAPPAEGPQVAATRYEQRNLVSDMPGPAEKTDPNLVNPWGLSMNPTGPFWVSNNRTGTSTLYNTAGDVNPLVVRIPAATGRTGNSTPTGQVWNGTPGFELAPGKPARFLFVTEDGTVAGWQPDVDASNAITMVDNSGSGAVYKGMALGVRNGSPVLYAANFGAGTIDAFDYAFRPLATGGGFNDPNLPAGFAPFNIQRIGARLYVVYARQDDARHNDVAGAGNGYINVFDSDGNLRQRLVSGGPLNSPWGMAIAPAFYGDFSNTLLVANFGDGRINAFDVASGEFLGPLTGADGNPIVIDGIWALAVGNGRNGGDATTVYFTAGIAGENHGLLGSLRPAQ